jgi:hydrogenase expression/formation protein HypC
LHVAILSGRFLKLNQMCLAVPGKIVAIDDSNREMIMADVQFGEVIKEICIQWIDKPGIGDFIIAHVGVALNKISEADAKATLDAINEMGEADPNAAL